ncbi:MAG: hypothetical protein EAZ97_03570 [Bacteroidetes bacterium]|nr:MAG: hypothetical protein EAZ97_03570 [Bacteroidota bacterium]
MKVRNKEKEKDDKNLVFEKEQNILQHSQKVLEESESLSKIKWASEYETLMSSYAQLLNETKLLTSVSDRLQNKLNKANDQIAKKNAELQETIDELTKAKASRKAGTIILLIAIGFFLFSELIDPYVMALVNATDSLFHSMIVPFLIKGVLVVVLKPIESFVEDRLLKLAQKQKKKEQEAAIA